MVERCGAFKYIMQPGLSFVICCVDEASNHVSMRLQQIKVTCETKTKDNVFTNIDIKTVIPKLQLTLANVVSNFVLRQEMGE